MEGRRQGPAEVSRVIIVGAGVLGRSFAREARETPGMRIVGFLDDNISLRGRRIAGQRVLGSLSEADRAIAQSSATDVVVTIASLPPDRLAQLSAACEIAEVTCSLMPGAWRPSRGSRGHDGVTPTRRWRRRLSPELAVLLLVYIATVAIGLWQASNRLSPTIFTDELEMTQLSRSFLATGHATLRGQPIHGLAPLAAYLSAPFWWIDDVPTAYAFLKGFGVLIMATAVFPAYAIARLAVAPRWALFAAAGTGLAPALAYAPILVKEPTAYPAATLALFLIARWIAAPLGQGSDPGCRRVHRWVALTKDQLAVLFPILVLAGLAVVWRGARATAFRRTWTPADWLGAVTLAVGVVLLVGCVYRSPLGLVVRRDDVLSGPDAQVRPLGRRCARHRPRRRALGGGARLARSAKG